jgi:DNA-binding NarL/FixJ family response regulator
MGGVVSGYSVVIVDDHPALREGIRMILDRAGGFVVVAEAGSVRNAIGAIRQHQPDFAVVDLGLADGDGIEVVRSASQDSPETKVLVLTMFAQKEMADAAIAAGAHGYLLKESSTKELVPFLHAIRSGQTPVDHRICALDLGLSQLTTREVEVFRLLAIGRNTKEIGAQLGISSKTVDNHRASIFQKTNCNSIVDIVRLAIRIGVVQP